MINDRREFMAAGLTVLAASLGERLAAESSEPRVEGFNAQQPAANASRAVATKDAPKVNLDGWQMTATEITIPPGAPPGRKHRHPGFVIGYVLEGSYSFAVNDQAPKVFTAGEMFFESFDAPGDTHSTSGNASTIQPVKFLAIVFTKKGDPVTIPG
ncbi:MAG TPA: cupin domain-containing protein [Vicinamibacterales bacterium]|nr:cupin domain-containing protein [Vicinamibacterales bacterium]